MRAELPNRYTTFPFDLPKDDFGARVSVLMGKCHVSRERNLGRLQEERSTTLSIGAVPVDAEQGADVFAG